MCLDGTLAFMKTQRITGDLNKKQNGFSYDVYGSSKETGLGDTTWYQRNMNHANHRVRRIFRFDYRT